MMKHDSSDQVALQSYVQRHFTPYAYVSSLDKQRSEASLGIQIEEIIPDKGRGATMRMVELDDVVSLRWRFSRNKIRTSGLTRSQFANTVRKQYLNILHRSQNALLPTLYTRLVKIPQVSLAMSPLQKIVEKVHEDETITPEDFHKKAEDTLHVQKYFTLLLDLEFIKPENSHYVAGTRMRILEEGQIESDKLYARILGEVLQKRLPYLKGVLHWTMLAPYLQWSNSYYFPAYEAGRIIKTEKDDLVMAYRRFYKVSTELDEMYQLGRIVGVKVLHKQKSLYEGDATIFHEYQKKADSQKILEPDLAPQIAA